MDKLKAIKVLGLNNNNPTFEEIKEAYKIVIEDVHPEEDPETFSQIQSAYRFLRSQIFNKQNNKQNKTYDNFDHKIINEEDTIVIEKEEIKENIKDDNDLEELFDDIYENSNEFFNKKSQIAEDIDTLRAFVLGYIPIEKIHPDYLAYLLKIFPLLQKRYKEIGNRFKTFTQNQTTKRNTDVTTIGGFICIAALIFGFSSMPIAFILSLFVAEDKVITYWLIIGFLITGISMYFLVKKRKEKNKDNPRVDLLKQYKESRDFIYEKIGIIPMNKKEIIITTIVSIINIIPYFLALKYESAFIYIALIQTVLPFAYYAFRKEVAKESCGIYSIFIVFIFQFLVTEVFSSNNATGILLSAPLCLINLIFLQFKIIKMIVVKIKRNKNKDNNILYI